MADRPICAEIQTTFHTGEMPPADSISLHVNKVQAVFKTNESQAHHTFPCPELCDHLSWKIPEAFTQRKSNFLRQEVQRLLDCQILHPDKQSTINKKSQIYVAKS